MVTLMDVCVGIHVVDCCHLNLHQSPSLQFTCFFVQMTSTILFYTACCYVLLVDSEYLVNILNILSC